MDRKDALIIKTFLDYKDNENISAYFIAKEIFGLKNSRETLYERRRKSMFVTKRLEKLVKLGLVELLKVEKKGKMDARYYKPIPGRCMLRTVDGVRFIQMSPNEKEWHMFAV